MGLLASARSAWLAGATAAALALGLALEPTSAGQLLGAAPAGRVALRPCHLADFPEQVLCGAWRVAEDRRAPGGRSIDLQFAVLPALRRDVRADPLVLLAGGPGQAARELAPLAERFFRRLRRTRDVLLVDLRGTGASEPLRCPEPKRPAPLLSAQPVDVLACRAAQRADPRRYTNAPAVQDLEELRVALGYGRLNLWGGSFGTRTALVYARRFPGQVRSLVLDGAAPLELRFPLHAAEDMQRALDLLLRDCAADPACQRAYPRLAADLGALLARLETRPATVAWLDPSTGQPRGATLGREQFVLGLRAFLYTPLNASLVPFVVEQAARGRYGPFLALAEEDAAWSVDTMALGATLSVVCSEDVARIRDDEARGAGAGTLLGRTLVDAWTGMCANWPRGDAPEPLGEDRPSRAPALVLSGALDPVTPPRWGEIMARHFPNSRALAVPGAAHNASFIGCVPELIADFVEAADARGLDAACLERTRRPPFVVALSGTEP